MAPETARAFAAAEQAADKAGDSFVSVERLLQALAADKDSEAGKLLAKGGWDYALVDDLQPKPGDIVVPKTRYSGFFNSQFDSILRARGIRNLVFCGIATNVCVESTLRDGFHLEYFGVMLEDATHQAGPDYIQKASIFNIETFFGWVSTASDFRRAFAQTETAPAKEDTP